MRPEGGQDGRDARDGARPRVAVSACLLGIPVRYDGGHRRSQFLVEVLGPRIEWVRVCPEVEIGLGTPRSTIALHDSGDPRRPRLLQGDRDLAARMRGYALGRIEELRVRGIDAYVLKARSPSCGLGQVKLVRAGGEVVRAGVGVFAQALRETWPELPAFEETDLDVPAVAAARVDWIFTMFHFRRRAPGLAGLAAFHEEHGPRLALGDPAAERELAQILVDARLRDLPGSLLRYERRLSAALRRAGVSGRNRH